MKFIKALPIFSYQDFKILIFFLFVTTYFVKILKYSSISIKEICEKHPDISQTDPREWKLGIFYKVISNISQQRNILSSNFPSQYLKQFEKLLFLLYLFTGHFLKKNKNIWKIYLVSNIFQFYFVPKVKLRARWNWNSVLINRWSLSSIAMFWMKNSLISWFQILCFFPSDFTFGSTDQLSVMLTRPKPDYLLIA